MRGTAADSSVPGQHIRQRVAGRPQPKRVFKPTMKVTVKSWHAVAEWRWDTGQQTAADDGEDDVCGICRLPFEACCPACKVPGDDCPLSASRPQSCYC